MICILYDFSVHSNGQIHFFYTGIKKNSPDATTVSFASFTEMVKGTGAPASLEAIIGHGNIIDIVSLQLHIDTISFRLEDRTSLHVPDRRFAHTGFENHFFDV